MLEHFADTFNPLELSTDMVVVKVTLKQDTARRNFYIPVQGARGFVAITAACEYILHVMRSEYMDEHDEEYVDVDSNYIINLHDDSGNLIEVDSDGELLEVFFAELVSETKVIESAGSEIKAQ